METSDNLYNERRRLSRAYQRNIDSLDFDTRASIEELISGSYIRTNRKRGIVGVSLTEAVANLAEAGRLISGYTAGESYRFLDNEIFYKEFKNAARGATSTIDQGVVKLFYSSLKRAWHTGGLGSTSREQWERRNERIIDYLNNIGKYVEDENGRPVIDPKTGRPIDNPEHREVRTLKEAFDKWLSLNPDLVEAIENADPGEKMDWYEMFKLTIASRFK